MPSSTDGLRPADPDAGTSLGVPVSPGSGLLRPLGLAEVRIVGGFWGERQHVNGAATIAHIEYWLEREGWLGNFDAAVQGRLPGARRGREFSDSEVYKLLEAMAWEIGRTGDEAIQGRYDAIVARVAAAQEVDGYLHTNFGRPGQAPRYSDLEWGHELYCFGHLIQAAVARLRTRGDHLLVQVARRAADHVCRVFGEGGIESVCGHAEVEPALVELARATGERRYLEQARLFVERRGHHVLGDIEFGRAYFQDDVPVREAEVLRGHAVRAMYFASGAVDVAAETGDDELRDAVRGQFAATLARRTYLTGGMGSRHQDEAFGEDFVLPPDRAYSETCAAIGSVMLAWRLLLADADPAWADVIERALFNVVATSPAPDGRSFYYANTLHQRELAGVPEPDVVSARAASSLRAPWFTVSCCPTNVARTFAGLGAYVATVDDAGLQLHQYAPVRIRTRLPDGREVAVDVETDYPRSGTVRVRAAGPERQRWVLTLRVPAWAQGADVVSGGTRHAARPGAFRLEVDLAPGEEVLLELGVGPRFVWPDPRIDAVRGCVAVQRGPEVFCLESADLPDGVDVSQFRVDPAVAPTERDGRVRVRGTIGTQPDADWPYAARPWGVGEHSAPVEVPLVAYHDWANRGPSTMRVWLPTDAPTQA
ncbi:glycoside hydrolase family 127 protein [Occultella gossypii]|uniref:Glycoside hydrolase family 127 protein n=1 Tax=Occultella gossypii TaxID=2800820 RepID=A0ABS7S6R7_9MICO|nr:beta-L-arabinofuranosidase domain-containing protein [Occultella gossypii]MBZ2194996.1 glycoside hydrolase family 127 protein [Occultella gossypii]